MGPRANPAPSVKDVAAVAGVSLGTVSNVLNRPDRVSDATRVRVERAMAELGFVRNEWRPPAPSGQQPHARLRDAGRDEPVLHRRRPGCRGHRRRGRPLAVPLQQRQPPRPGAGLPQPVAGAARAGGADHARRPGLPHARRHHRPRHPGGDRGPDPQRRHALLGGGRRPSSADGSPADHLLEGGPPADRLRRRPVEHRAGARPTRGRSGGAGRCRAPARGPGGHRHRRPHRRPRAGPPGSRSAGLPAAARPTAAMCANDLLALGLLQQCVALGLEVPGTWRSSATTTSCSRPLPPYP